MECLARTDATFGSWNRRVVGGTFPPSREIAVPLHARTRAYKDLLLSAPYEICIERARLVTDSYRATEGQHPALRAARAFEHVTRHATVVILEGESIVGNRSSKLLGTVLPIERGDVNTVLELELSSLLARERQPFLMSPEDRRELEERILPYWRGRTVRDHRRRLWWSQGWRLRPALDLLSWYRRWRSLDVEGLRRSVAQPGPIPIGKAFRMIDEMLFNNPALAVNVFDVQGHLILGHRTVLREGFAGVKARALSRLGVARDRGDREGAAFLEAVAICCDAIRGFAGRFAAEAERRAGIAGSPERRRALLEIAERCRHVPFHPPRDFREAVQALWLTQVAAILAHGMPAIFAVGRLDQHLHAFYERDRSAGRLSDDEAVELLEELLIKLATNLLILPTAGKNTGNELGADSCAPTVGGVGPGGEDAVNALSYLVLDAFENVKSMGNSFTIRLSRRSPPEFWRRSLATFRATSGAALFNDEVAIPALVASGVEERHARDYGVIGCVEPTGDGDTFGCTSGNDISLAAAVEMALLDGHLRIMGRRIGPSTGDPRRFPTFDRFLRAFEAQVSFLVSVVVRAVNQKDRVYRDRFPNPFVSATIEGCVDAARDATAGGARYEFASIGARGFATAVDSLAAVEHFAFGPGGIRMDDLLSMLAWRFFGDETAQARLRSRTPRFGCDDDRADAIAKRVAEHFCREVGRHRSIRGGPFRPGFFSYGMHVLEGLFLGATPDGRQAGEPISNSFSPTNGAERNGPTAMLRSVAKIDHSRIGNGCSVNVKLLPSMFEGDERLDKMVSLVRGYFAEGGMELSINAVSNETLRDAQRHPERHRDLVVRVSGYSAFFTDLGTPLQDDIIRRTEFGESRWTLRV
jgi:formate C-acetyltransferase